MMPAICPHVEVNDVVRAGEFFVHYPQRPMVGFGVLIAAVRVHGSDMQLHIAGGANNINKKNR